MSDIIGILVDTDYNAFPVFEVDGQSGKKNFHGLINRATLQAIVRVAHRRYSGIDLGPLTNNKLKENHPCPYLRQVYDLMSSKR